MFGGRLDRQGEGQADSEGGLNVSVLHTAARAARRWRRKLTSSSR